MSAQWVVVLDSDEVSQRQVDVCTRLRVPGLGAIRCDQPDNEEAQVCQTIEYFPAFCRVATGECSYGLRTDAEEIRTLITGPTERTTDK